MPHKPLSLHLGPFLGQCVALLKLAAYVIAHIAYIFCVSLLGFLLMMSVVLLISLMVMAVAFLASGFVEAYLYFVNLF